jgi:cytochrome-b5 reductase
VLGRTAGRRASDINRTSRHPVTPDEWTALRLRSKQCLGGSVYEFSFELPSPFDTLPLAPGQAVSVRAILNGEECIRYYSPISRTNQPGHLDLPIKVEPDNGMMSRHLYFLKPGDTLQFKGPVGGFDFSVTDGSVKKVAMIAGGVGISPMIQVIRHVLHCDAPTDLTLVWGCERPGDIVYKQTLDRMASLHDNLKVVYYVDKPPADGSWTGEVGFIDRAAIEKHVCPPSDDLKIIICGPYRMCQAMKALLKQMGYADHMFFSYM